MNWSEVWQNIAPFLVIYVCLHDIYLTLIKVPRLQKDLRESRASFAKHILIGDYTTE